MWLSAIYGRSPHFAALTPPGSRPTIAGGCCNKRSRSPFRKAEVPETGTALAASFDGAPGCHVGGRPVTANVGFCPHTVGMAETILFPQIANARHDALETDAVLALERAIQGLRDIAWSARLLERTEERGVIQLPG